MQRPRRATLTPLLRMAAYAADMDAAMQRSAARRAVDVAAIQAWLRAHRGMAAPVAQPAPDVRVYSWLAKHLWGRITEARAALRLRPLDMFSPGWIRDVFGVRVVYDLDTHLRLVGMEVRWDGLRRAWITAACT